VALLVDGHHTSGSAIAVDFERTPGKVVVEGHGPSVADPPDHEGPDQEGMDDLVLEILRVVVDDHSFDAGAAGRRFRLVKRTRAAS
jgi:hypothetical protein